MGSFLARMGERAYEPEAEYRAALKLSPQFTPAAVNLVDLYRQLGRDDDGASVLRAAIVASPRDAGLHHALGLALIRLRQPASALVELRQAAELQPGHARYAYVYAVGLHSSGRLDEALSILKREVATHPRDRDILTALAAFSRDAGHHADAIEYAKRLEAR